MMYRLITLFFFILFGSYVHAQNEGNIWYFGDFAGIDFNQSPPVPLTNSAMTQGEGVASIADRNTGVLLFYTNGQQVWNANHVAMPNGTGLMGDGSSTQSAIIIPKPGSTTVYYIFAVDNEGQVNGLSYSEVDMTLDGGLGDITAIKNVQLHTPVAEKVTGVTHANGSDIWVVTHGYNDDLYLSYLVTSAGVNATPVTTNIGNIHGGIGIGELKGSPNNSMLASVCWSANNVEVLQFDNSTGIPFNPITLPNLGSEYGVEFSPDNSKLYVSEWATNGSSLFQYELGSFTTNDITNSQYLVFNGSGSDGSISVAPDGKLYVANVSEDSLGVIHSPNSPGVACNYIDQSFGLNGRICMGGLPNFITTFLAVNLNANFTAFNFCLGDTTFFTDASSGGTIDSLNWDFGDPGSGPLNSDTASAPYHIYSTAGVYDVTLIVWDSVFSDTVVIPITINEVPIADLGPDLSICGVDSLTLTAGSSGYTYAWSGGQTTESITITLPGTYWVNVDNNGCAATDTILVTAVPPTVNLGPDTIVCGTFALTAPALGPYQWNTGETTQSIAINAEGTYWVEVGSAGCIASDTINIGYLAGGNIAPPNVFTPNGDLKNDEFNFGGTNLIVFNLKIYNRWGVEIFVSTDASIHWDGQFNSKAVPAGVYYWMLTYQSECGMEEPATEKGTVTIFR